MLGSFTKIWTLMSIGSALVVWRLSFTTPIVRNYLNIWVAFLLLMIYVDILYGLHSYSFDLDFQRTFLLFLVMAAWYMRKPQELFWLLLLAMLGLWSTAQASPQLEHLITPFMQESLWLSIMIFVIMSVQSLNLEKIRHRANQETFLFEQLPIGILKVNEAGKIIDANKHFYDLSELKHEEVLELKHFSEILTDKSRSQLHKHLKGRGDVPKSFCEIEMSGEDKMTKHLDLTILSGNGEISESKEYTSLVQDSTAKKVSAQSIEKGIQKISEVQGQIAQLQQELEQFSHIVASDLKSPFYSILEKYKRGKGADFITESFIQEVHDSVEKVRSLQMSIGEFSTIGEHDLEPQLVNLNKLIPNVESQLQYDILLSQAQIIYDQLQPVYADPVLINSVLFHLIENALKFRSSAAPLIYIKCKENKALNLVRIEISDNGQGLDSVFFENVFLIFQKGPYPNSPGAGVGLAIVKAIVQLHEGKVGLEPSRSKGLKVWIELPLSR